MPRNDKLDCFIKIVGINIKNSLLQEQKKNPKTFLLSGFFYQIQIFITKLTNLLLYRQNQICCYSFQNLKGRFCHFIAFSI
jgi:hypothetical protein